MRLENQLFTEDEFQAAKSREKVLRMSCMHCGQEFLVRRREVLAALNPKQRTTLSTCSITCSVTRSFSKERTEVKCTACGKMVARREGEISRSRKGTGNMFCSRKCAYLHRTKNRFHGTRRSKLEVWIEKQLTSKYPDLEVHYNRKDGIGSELDIYFPSLKLAFELNGIFHYEPIFGEDKLEKTRTNDNRKFLACHQAGISLCIIDTSSMVNFKELKAEKYLRIITEVLGRQWN